jgi:hypothetical protein
MPEKILVNNIPNFKVRILMKGILWAFPKKREPRAISMEEFFSR